MVLPVSFPGLAQSLGMGLGFYRVSTIGQKRQSIAFLLWKSKLALPRLCLCNVAHLYI